jgi:DNA replication protein DnaC
MTEREIDVIEEEAPAGPVVVERRSLTPGEIRSHGGWGTVLEPAGSVFLADVAKARPGGPVEVDPDGVPVVVKRCPGPGCSTVLRLRCEVAPSRLVVQLMQRALCDPCIEKLNAADERRRVEDAMRERVAESRMPRSLLDEVSWESLLEKAASPTDTERRRRAIERAREWAECEDFSGRKPGLLLWGDPGTGKTRLMATAAKARLEHSPIRWVSVGVLMAELQGAWADTDRKQALKVLTSKGAVALDDFDKVNPTDSTRMQLFTALDKREQARTPIIVTTNCKPSDLSKKLGDVIASRLVGMCEVLAYPGPDRRLEIGEA